MFVMYRDSKLTQIPRCVDVLSKPMVKNVSEQKFYTLSRQWRPKQSDMAIFLERSMEYFLSQHSNGE